MTSTLQSGKWYCVEYNFDDERCRSVYGPVKKTKTGFQFPQCEGARWNEEGTQLHTFCPSKVIREATAQEVKHLYWFETKTECNEPIYNRSLP